MVQVNSLQSSSDESGQVNLMKQHPLLGVFFIEQDAKMSESLLEVDLSHMTKAIVEPISVNQEQLTSKYSFEDFLNLFDKTEIPQEMFELWRGYQEQPLFSTKKVIRYRLTTYEHFLKSDSCPQEIKSMMSLIISHCIDLPDKYDICGIFMALAQNGGVCNVQKQIGIRAVYAAMMDSMMEHMNANSLENKVLSLLKKNRLVLSEVVAMNICRQKNLYDGKVLNSHLVIPLQNKIAQQIGIEIVHDEHASYVESEGEFESFLKLYNVEHIIKVISGALNDKHRLINYHDAVEQFEIFKPKELDSFSYMNDFVFDIDTGKFTDRAVKYLLLRLGILSFTKDTSKGNPEKELKGWADKQDESQESGPGQISETRRQEAVEEKKPQARVV